MTPHNPPNSTSSAHEWFEYAHEMARRSALRIKWAIWITVVCIVLTAVNVALILH